MGNMLNMVGTTTGSNITIDELAVTENGTYTAPEGTAYSPVVVNVPQGGGLVESDVNFYDYDGTLLYSYKKDDFLALTTMPDNIAPEGFAAQGWNWTLTDAKEFVTACGILDIGQVCIAADRNTHLFVNIPPKWQTINMYLGSATSYYTAGTIDWGDGTTDSFNNNSTFVKSHTYAEVGRYEIIIAVTSTNALKLGTEILFSNASTDAALAVQWILEKAYIGEKAILGQQAFSRCVNLRELTFPEGSNMYFGNTTVTHAQLKAIVFPQSQTYTAYFLNGGSYGHILLSKTAPIANVSEVGCASRLCIAKITTTYLNNSVLDELAVYYLGANFSVYGTYSISGLRRVTIKGSGTINIGNSSLLGTCSALESLSITGTTLNGSVTGPRSLKSIYLDVTSVISGFASIESVTSLVFSNRVQTIGSFTMPLSLGKLTIPSSCVTVYNGAFANAYNLLCLRFEAVAPPTFSGSNTFTNLNTFCPILIPYESLAYLTATNYPSPSTYLYLGFETFSSGVSLPTAISPYDLHWYATIEDAQSYENEIYEGNGEEVFCIYTPQL